MHLRGKDHNWCWHELRKHYEKEALSESKWPNLDPGKKRKADVNKHHNLTTTVRTQTSRRTEGQAKRHKMNRFIAEDLEALHLSTWTPIRDQSPPTDQANTNQGQSVETTGALCTEKWGVEYEAAMKIHKAYEVARRADKLPLPRHAVGAH